MFTPFIYRTALMYEQFSFICPHQSFSFHWSETSNDKYLDVDGVENYIVQVKGSFQLLCS